MNPIGLLIVAGGLFSIAGAAFEWDWFMNSRKAAFLVAILSRTGARIFYMLLGIVLVTMGILLTANIIQNAG